MLGSPNNSTDKQLARINQRIDSINKVLILAKCQNRVICRSILRMKLLIAIETICLIGIGLFVLLKL